MPMTGTEFNAFLGKRTRDVFADKIAEQNAALWNVDDIGTCKQNVQVFRQFDRLSCPHL